MEPKNKKPLELLVFRHAESTFIAAYHARRDEFKRNETELTPYDREKMYTEFALKHEFVDSLLTKDGER
jgi:hypothetical protein